MHLSSQYLNCTFLLLLCVIPSKIAAATVSQILRTEEHQAQVNPYQERAQPNSNPNAAILRRIDSLINQGKQQLRAGDPQPQKVFEEAVAVSQTILFRGQPDIRSLTNLGTRHSQQPRVLAAAFIQGRYSSSVGSRKFIFTGLPFAEREVENLEATVANTTTLRDRDFSPEATIPRMNNYSSVHLATHAAFVIGQPEEFVYSVWRR